jgi:2-hydroxychromene-2-carboxylate isomerase
VFSIDGVERLAHELGLDDERYHSCVVEGRPIPQLQADVDAARALGIGSTPTVFIDDEVYRQQRTFGLMSAAIEEALAGE